MARAEVWPYPASSVNNTSISLDPTALKSDGFYRSHLGILIAVYSSGRSLKLRSSDVIHPETIFDAIVRTLASINHGLQFFYCVGRSHRPLSERG
jgi:hypothetical protein